VGLRDHFVIGTWNCTCDRCGQKRKAYELRREWDGIMTCKRCWEPRQPQDFVRGVADDQSAPWTRPDPEPTYVDPATRPEDVL